jgi:hypothetical protein
MTWLKKVKFFCTNIQVPWALHGKKCFSIFPSPARMPLTTLSLEGNNLYMTSLLPPRESLVSEITAGDGNIEKLFLRCLSNPSSEPESIREKYLGYVVFASHFRGWQVYVGTLFYIQWRVQSIVHPPCHTQPQHTLPASKARQLI